MKNIVSWVDIPNYRSQPPAHLTELFYVLKFFEGGDAARPRKIFGAACKN
jgi:hypothetical protein